MPVMVNHIAERNYPQLDRLHGGSAAGGVWNTVIALAVLCGLAVATLPLWLQAAIFLVGADLIMYWKIYSKMGLGARLSNGSSMGSGVQSIDGLFGDCVFLAIADNVP